MKNAVFLSLAVATGFVALPASAADADPSAGTAQPAQSGTASVENLGEVEGQKYQFVGARFRYIVIPKFMMNVFGDGGTTVGVPAFGPEFAVRKNHFEYVLSAMYASYAMSGVPFKSASDPDVAYEIVDANLKVLYFMSEFLWSNDISSTVQGFYGAGAGLGVVWGDLSRVQSYPQSGVAGDPYSYKPCLGQSIPDPVYCGKDNNHYPGYQEDNWLNGGSKPILFPWLSANGGFRFKPSNHFAARLDLGWNLFNGPFFGLAGSYGL